MTSITGFLTTPATCGVMSLLQQGTAFEQTILSDVAAVQTGLNVAAASILNLPNQIEGILLTDAQALANRLTALVTGTLTSFVSHLTSQFTNLVNNLSIGINQAAAQAGLISSGCSTPGMGSIGTNGGDPCGNMSNLFGSIMGAGANLVSQITGTLNNLTSTITSGISGALGAATAVLNQITSVVTSIEGVVANVASMITSEVAALAAAISDMLTFGAANALQSLFSNPCAQSVLNAVGTPALLSHLG